MTDSETVHYQAYRSRVLMVSAYVAHNDPVLRQLIQDWIEQDVSARAFAVLESAVSHLWEYRRAKVEVPPDDDELPF